MKKIFVFYDSEDIVIARKVAQEIDATGFSPWLADDDNRIDWHAEIEELAPSDACVGAVAIWSQSSKNNPVVRDEAKEVTRVQKPLLGLLLKGTSEAPIDLRDGPRHRLESGPEDNINGRLGAKLTAVFGKGEARDRALVLKDKKLFAPGIVLSVSSYETQIEPDTTLSLLNHANPPAVLVSAYDILRPKLTSTKKPKITNFTAIDRLREAGSMVFLDSGNYEASHPEKDGVSYSFQNTDLIDHDTISTGKGGLIPGLIHYTTPTIPGSSGGIALNASLEMIGLHRAGGTEINRLNGQPGSYAVNEAIWIQPILNSTRLDLANGRCRWGGD